MQQGTLFELDANLDHVRQWVIGQLASGPIHWKELLTSVRAEDWLEKHVNDSVRNLKAEGVIAHSPIAPGRKFGAAANPILRIQT